MDFGADSNLLSSVFQGLSLCNLVTYSKTKLPLRDSGSQNGGRGSPKVSMAQSHRGKLIWICFVFFHVTDLGFPHDMTSNWGALLCSLLAAEK